MRMISRILTTTCLIGTVASPAWAEFTPTADDAVMFWREFQLSGPADSPRNDLHVYFIKQWWLSPNLGLYAFYGTLQSITARVQYKLPLLSEVLEDGTVTPAKLVLTGMAGYRAAVMGSSPATFSSGFREGPEIAASVAVPLAKGLTWSCNASLAHTLATNGGNAAALVFYGSTLNMALNDKTGIAVGFLASFLAPYGNALAFHNLGPTLSISHKF